MQLEGTFTSECDDCADPSTAEFDLFRCGRSDPSNLVKMDTMESETMKRRIKKITDPNPKIVDVIRATEGAAVNPVQSNTRIAQVITRIGSWIANNPITMIGR